MFMKFVCVNGQHEVFDIGHTLLGHIIKTNESEWVFAPRSYCNSITLEEMKEITKYMEEL